MEKWNQEIARDRGRGSAEGSLEKEDEEGLVKAIELVRTGWMSLDIQIPDPRVGLSDSASMEQQQQQSRSQPQQAVVSPRPGTPTQA